jgi:hypothetical protein
LLSERPAVAIRSRFDQVQMVSHPFRKSCEMDGAPSSFAGSRVRHSDTLRCRRH